MRVDRFIAQGQERWHDLESLLNRTQGSVSKLSEHDLESLGKLYWQITSDLAIAQRDYPNHRVTQYLNQLVGQAHGLIYQEEPLHGQRVRSFYQVTFPRLYRQILPYTMSAFLLFLLPAVIAFILVWQDSDRIFIMLGPGVSDLVQTVEHGDLWTDIAPTVRSAASSAILTNNIQVMFLTFAGGMTAGLLTIYVLVTNGLQIGAIFGLLQSHELSQGLAEFVVAHGFIEMSVIFLAGGCGLYVGDSIVRPGLYRRREALMAGGRTSVQLIVGSVPLLILAGLIEGFISPSQLPWPLKLAVGLSTGLALHLYWLLGGRKTETASQRARPDT